MPFIFHCRQPSLLRADSQQTLRIISSNLSLPCWEAILKTDIYFILSIFLPFSVVSVLQVELLRLWPVENQHRNDTKKRLWKGKYFCQLQCVRALLLITCHRKLMNVTPVCRGLISSTEWKNTLFHKPSSDFLWLFTLTAESLLWLITPVRWREPFMSPRCPPWHDSSEKTLQSDETCVFSTMCIPSLFRIH